jgi:putative transposase
VDNGSAFVDSWLLRACASLGIKLVHSAPGRPQGRGKIERFFRTVRDQFLVEITSEAASAITGLAELNRLFTAWTETVYHPRAHSETGAPPLRRWQEGVPVPLPLPTPAQLAEAFLWSEFRTVTKTAAVSLHGNTYQVDELLAGRKVELVFDPFNLADIEVRYGGRGFGKAAPFTIGRHSHPKARPEQPGRPAPPAAGINYLNLIDTAHGSELEQRINYAALLGGSPDPGPGTPAASGPLPGQMTLDEALPDAPQEES